jgi:AcrR family transcriptional regulator
MWFFFSAVLVYSVYLVGRSTSDRIIAAARSIFEAEGAQAVSMRRVASAVGITAMAIYKHFPDREALLNAIVDAGFQELRARYLKTNHLSTEKYLMHLLDEYLEFALEHPRLFEYMFSAPRPGARQFPRDFVAGRSPTASVVAEQVSRAMEAGILRRDDAWEVEMALAGMAHGLIVLYLGGRSNLPPDKFRQFYRRSLRRLIDGLSN